jgi:hypothetical protein
MSYSIIVENQVGKTVSVSCGVDMYATVAILKMLPNVNNKFYQMSSDNKEFYEIEPAITQFGNSVSLYNTKDINWASVTRAINQYLEISDQQKWVKERAQIIMDIAQNTSFLPHGDVVTTLTPKVLGEALFGK